SSLGSGRGDVPGQSLIRRMAGGHLGIPPAGRSGCRGVMSRFVLEGWEAVVGGLADRGHRPTFRAALNEHALTPRLIGGKIDFRIQTDFTDPESKRGALGRLAGRHPFKNWATGEMLVPEA